MPNNTLNSYKEAVRNKYEKEKEGIYSNYLSSPSQANLRDLCWEIFKSNKNVDDLAVYKKFFKFEFDANNEDTSITYTNKFKKVGGFFRGGIEPAKIDTINFAAILVNYELRPYTKFTKVGVKEKDIKEEVDGSAGSESQNVKDNLGVISIEKGNTKKDKILTNFFFATAKGRFLGRLFKKTKSTVAAVIIIFCLIAAASYFSFFKKDYMQWSKDHYEVVSKEGIEGNPNEIIEYDDHLLDFKKIPVCDTTTWFVNGKSIIWYAKTNSKVDFFTACGYGRHPESGSTLRPVSEYIRGKYKKPCGSK